MKRVVKLGGSLVNNGTITAAFIKLNAWQDSVLVVPGGGVFADQVRALQSEWCFDDRSAHVMAILAMQQMAILLQSRLPNFKLISGVDRLSNDGERMIWSPSVAELDAAAIPSTWDISSDSLAAWIAGVWDADELWVIKSAPIASGQTIAVLQQQGVLDQAFERYSQESSFVSHIINIADMPSL